MKLRDVGIVLIVLGFLWGCAWLRLYHYGNQHPDAFKEFLSSHQCYAAGRKTDAMGRKFTPYLCDDPADNVDLYEMSKGPGEK